jgi:hypothetical protein
MEGNSGEFITVLYPGNNVPVIEKIESGVRVGRDEITFQSGVDDIKESIYVMVRRPGGNLVSLTGRDIDMNRFQGDVGLFVPDAGYPFGVIPDWLIKQRNRIPDWAPDWVYRARKYDLEYIADEQE